MTPHGPVERPSGFRQLVGYRLDDWKADCCRLALTIGPRHLNRGGVVHGGVVTTMIDAAGGYAGCHCDTPGRVRRSATVSLTTQFLTPVRAGTLVATGRVRGGGKRIFIASVEVHDGEGKLVAIGEGVYRYRAGSEDPAGVPLDTGAELRETDLG